MVWITCVYLLSASLFIWGLKQLGRPETARRGNLLSAIGMYIAIVATLFENDILQFQWIFICSIIGSFIGFIVAKRVKMTGMPELVALLNGAGGGSSLALGIGVIFSDQVTNTIFLLTIILSVLIGGLTLSGSLIAWGKLNGRLSGKPFVFKGSLFLTIAVFILLIVVSCLFIVSSTPVWLYLLAGLSLLLGILLVMAINGGDMPVVISLLNSYSGLAACAVGLSMGYILLVVAGALVGASGLILTYTMCKAMNRPLISVLFGGFLQSTFSQVEIKGEVSSLSTEDAYYLLEAAKSVLIVPGYGLAVAQAQHAIHELDQILTQNGADIRYVVHPVAGRMPGHMNVLLAEANVDYEQLAEMEDVNPSISTVDVCIIVGANDVVNLDARDNKDSPLFGMPIINVDHAKHVIVLKRSMGTGFSGVQNPLFFKNNVRMLFGDAKTTLLGVIGVFKT